MNRVGRHHYRLLLKKAQSSRLFGVTSVKLTAENEDSTINIIGKTNFGTQYDFEPKMLTSNVFKRHKEQGKARLSFYNAWAASVGYCCVPGNFDIGNMAFTVVGVQFCAMSAASLNIGKFVTISGLI